MDCFGEYYPVKTGVEEIVRRLSDSGAMGGALLHRLRYIGLVYRPFPTPARHGTAGSGCVEVFGDGVLGVVEVAGVLVDPPVPTYWCFGDFSGNLFPEIEFTKSHQAEVFPGRHPVDVRGAYATCVPSSCGRRNFIDVTFRVPTERPGDPGLSQYFSLTPSLAESEMAWRINHVRRHHMPRDTSRCPECRNACLKSDARGKTTFVELICEEAADAETGEDLTGKVLA